MSNIVLGLATSHSPLLTFGAEMWVERSKDDHNNARLCLADGRTLTYEELALECSNRYADHAQFVNLQAQAALAQKSLDRLAFDLAAADPEVAIIVGDDQGELYGPNSTPAISVFHGEEIVMHPLSRVRKNLPEWRKIAAREYLLDAPHRFPGAPDYGEAIVRHLIARDIDVGVCTQVAEPERAGFGHAYGFIINRLFKGRSIPVVPVLLNTYYPPNVPRAQRCYDIGRVLCEAIQAAGAPQRVAVIASGGLSHFVTDETLDRGILAALAQRDSEALRRLPMQALRSGNSEILNWILAAGALEDLSLTWSEYIPVYRTPAGTGIGLGFASWSAAASTARISHDH